MNTSSLSKSTLVALAVILGLFCTTVIARTFPVNAGEDINDLTPGDGLCVAYLIVNPPFVLPFCSLRGAIEEANAYPGRDVIELPSAVFNLNIPGDSEDNAATGDLDIHDSLTIIGKGADKTIIDGRALDRIFHITDSKVEVTIKDLSIINGKVVANTPGYPKGGAAIRNRGSLRLENVVLLNHETSGGGSGDLAGIIFNRGDCQIVNSTLQGGKAHSGGAFYNYSGAEMTISSTTINANIAVVGGGGVNNGQLTVKNSTFSGNGNSQTNFGGGLDNSGLTSLYHTTFAFNMASSGGGISSRSSLYLQNTILGNNTGGDCHNPRYIYSNDNNLDSDNSCELTEASDISGGKPGFQSLKNNGGMTMTHTLSPLSQGRDVGKLISGLEIDQRGKVRPQGVGVDIGAVENNVFALPPLISPIIPN